MVVHRKQAGLGLYSGCSRRRQPGTWNLSIQSRVAAASSTADRPAAACLSRVADAYHDELAPCQTVASAPPWGCAMPVALQDLQSGRTPQQFERSGRRSCLVCTPAQHTQTALCPRALLPVHVRESGRACSATLVQLAARPDTTRETLMGSWTAN